MASVGTSPSTRPSGVMEDITLLTCSPPSPPPTSGYGLQNGIGVEGVYGRPWGSPMDGAGIGGCAPFTPACGLPSAASPVPSASARASGMWCCGCAVEESGMGRGSRREGAGGGWDGICGAPLGISRWLALVKGHFEVAWGVCNWQTDGQDPHICGAPSAACQGHIARQV